MKRADNMSITFQCQQKSVALDTVRHFLLQISKYAQHATSEKSNFDECSSSRYDEPLMLIGSFRDSINAPEL